MESEFSSFKPLLHSAGDWGHGFYSSALQPPQTAAIIYVIQEDIRGWKLGTFLIVFHSTSPQQKKPSEKDHLTRTSLCVERRVNGDLLCSTGNSTQHSVITYMEKESEKE